MYLNNNINRKIEEKAKVNHHTPKKSSGDGGDV